MGLTGTSTGLIDSAGPIMGVALKALVSLALMIAQLVPSDRQTNRTNILTSWLIKPNKINLSEPNQKIKKYKLINSTGNLPISKASKKQ